MKTYTHPDIQGFVSPAAFTLGGVQYPRSWWMTVEDHEIESMGFTEYVFPDPHPRNSPLSLHTIASAALSVENGELVGMERSLGLIMAFMPDPETAWLFFDEPQADADYIVTPSTGVSKYEDMIEIHKPNATSFKLLIQRLD